MSSTVDHVGQLLGGRYRLRQKLGAGGMGVVYEAWQEDLGRSVAVKLMTGASQESLLRFQREARAAASLGHPHIVQIFDFQTQPGEPPFIVMELVAGQSLREVVKIGGPLDESRAARLGAQVLSALEAAHQAGILHRDVKPANVLVTRSPTMGEIAKVLDFGIAKITEADAAPITQHGSVVGTLAYMSPEQARGEPLDGRSDVYSLAATLFFACTGERALAARSSDEMFLALVSGNVRPLARVRPGLDPTFCAIIERGLAADRGARFRTAQEMADALSQWLESRATSSASRPAASESIQAPATARFGATSPPAKRSNALFLGMGLLGGLAVVGAAAVVAAAGGYYYFYYAAEPGAATGGTAAPPSASSTGAGASAETAPAVASASAGAAGSTKTPTTPGGSPLGSAKPAPKPKSGAGKIGSPCSVYTDCYGPSECNNGKCKCRYEDCNGYCADRKSDKNHCGFCGNACKPGEICNGMCTKCDTYPMAMCNGRCVHLLLDFMNCGSCGNNCWGKLCKNGKCAP